MKYLLWFGGIVLAGVITMGAAIFVMHHAVQINFANPTPLEFWLSDAFLSFSMAMFVLLACWFAPAWRRNAVIFVVVFTVLFISVGIYSHIKYDGFLAVDHIIRYSSFLLAQALAVILSYRLFKDKRWTTQ